MKSFALYAIGFILLIVAAYFYANSQGFFGDSGIAYDSTQMSNVIQNSQQATNSLVSLSQSFSQQLSAAGLEFGSFSEIPHFLDISSTGDTAKVEILRDGNPFLTVFELQLPAGFTYDELIAQLQTSAANLDLQPATFGENSFYFLQDNFTTNILPLGNSALAFQFDASQFDSVKSFIASLQASR
jgi:hypothetical protein